MFSISDTKSTREVMERLVRIENHPKYEDVTTETLLETVDFIHRRYLFTYTKDAFRWIPSILLPLDYRHIRNDSYFDFGVGEVRFFIQPASERCYRVEGRATLQLQDDDSISVSVNIDCLEFKDSFSHIPSWVQRRLRDFIRLQIIEDLESMALKN